MMQSEKTNSDITRILRKSDAKISSWALYITIMEENSEKVSIEKQGQIQSFVSIKDYEDLQLWNEGDGTMVCLTSPSFIPLLNYLFFIHLSENEGGKWLAVEVGKSWPGRDRTKGGKTGSAWVSSLRNTKRNFCFLCSLPTASDEAFVFPQARSSTKTYTCAVSCVRSVKTIIFSNCTFLSENSNKVLAYTATRVILLIILWAMSPQGGLGTVAISANGFIVI